MKEKNTIILKAAATTNITDLKTSIYKNLCSDKVVKIDAIGEKATYIAIRAILFAKTLLMDNEEICVNTALVKLDTREGERRGIRWTLVLKTL